MDWFKHVQPWIDFAQAQNPLIDASMTGKDWAQLLVSGLIWLVHPVGARAVADPARRGEVSPSYLPARVAAMTPAPTDVPTTSSARSRSPATGWTTRRARCWSSSAGPGCCARRRPPRACRAGARAPGLGWVTAEYAMLPSATNTRSDRESVQGPDRRPHPRDLPADRPLAARGHRLQGARREHDRARLRRAPGRRRHPHRRHHRRLRRAGRRRAPTCASKGALAGEPLTGSVAAVSVGIIDGVPRLDLPYEEDVRAETDMNVVMTGDGEFVEVQGTAEGAPFDRAELDALLALAEKGCADLTRLQQEALAGELSVFLASRNAQEARRDAADPGARAAGHRGASASTTSTPYDEPVEDQPTFEGNALLKARAGLAATGLPSLADDSGLCVDALNGMPGVLSARWAGVAEGRRRQQPAAARAAGRRTRRAAWRALPLRGRVLPPRRRARHVVPRRDARPGDPRAAGERRLRLRRALRARRARTARSPRPS